MIHRLGQYGREILMLGRYLQTASPNSLLH
jgi:hypothetical protein